MPRKPPGTASVPRSDNEAGTVATQDGAPDAPPPAPPPSAPAVSTPTVQTRSQRNRRLVWLSVGFTTLVGAVWTALAGSMVENSRVYFTAKLEALQGVTEIKRLNGELTRKQTEYDALLASSTVPYTAFVALAFRDVDFCMDQITRWAKDNNAPLAFNHPPHFRIVNILYYNRLLELRCVGAKYGTATFLVITGTKTSSHEVDVAHADLTKELAAYSAYPAAIAPGNTDWFNVGPFVQAGYVTFEMRYADYKNWEQGKLPKYLVDALAGPGTIQNSTIIDTYAYFIFQQPGRSITFRSPDVDSYMMLAPDDTWKPAASVLQPGFLPTDDARVRTSVVVGLAALNYGKFVMDSVEGRYLGDDALAQIAQIPGVVNGGRITLFLRSF